MNLAPTRLAFSRHAARPRPSQAVPRRRYSTENAQTKGPSPHGQFYSSMLPDMIPIAILGSAVYLVSPTAIRRSSEHVRGDGQILTHNRRPPGSAPPAG